MKVQAKNGSTVNPDAEYHLSFQTTQADKRADGETASETGRRCYAGWGSAG